MGRCFVLSALVAVLALPSCGESEKPQSPDTSNAKFQADIARVYGFKCAICHGKEGISVIRTAPHLTETTMSFEERVAIIKYGEKTMPPQKDVLDIETIKGLAEYITTFQD